MIFFFLWGFLLKIKLEVEINGNLAQTQHNKLGNSLTGIDEKSSDELLSFHLSSSHFGIEFILFTKLF